MKKIDKKFNLLLPIKNEKLKRLGRNLDGGYVVDDSIIDNCKTLITFGLGNDWSFEEDYIKKNNKVKIHIYDHTINFYPYLKEVFKYFKRFLTFRTNSQSVINRIKNLIKFKKFIHSKNILFYKEKISSKDKNYTDVSKVFNRIASEEKVVIKVDIEGSEFEIINDLLLYSDRIEMLLFEFHDLDKNEKIFLELTKKLNEKFYIIHIHGNNHCEHPTGGLPVALEVTFMNKKYQPDKIEYVKNFPRKNLDFANNPFKEDLAFYFE